MRGKQKKYIEIKLSDFLDKHPVLFVATFTLLGIIISFILGICGIF